MTNFFNSTRKLIKLPSGNEAIAKLLGELIAKGGDAGAARKDVPVDQLVLEKIKNAAQSRPMEKLTASRLEEEQVSSPAASTFPTAVIEENAVRIKLEQIAKSFDGLHAKAEKYLWARPSWSEAARILREIAGGQQGKQAGELAASSRPSFGIGGPSQAMPAGVPPAPTTQWQEPNPDHNYQVGVDFAATERTEDGQERELGRARKSTSARENRSSRKSSQRAKSESQADGREAGLGRELGRETDTKSSNSSNRTQTTLRSGYPAYYLDLTNRWEEWGEFLEWIKQSGRPRAFECIWYSGLYGKWKGLLWPPPNIVLLGRASDGEEFWDQADALEDMKDAGWRTAIKLTPVKEIYPVPDWGLYVDQIIVEPPEVHIECDQAGSDEYVQPFIDSIIYQVRQHLKPKPRKENNDTESTNL